MTRMLKALGLAMGAMAALVAVMAPAAQAETGVLTAQQFPAVVTGPQPAGVTFDIGAGPIFAVNCGPAKLDATLEGPTDPVTFNPTYNACNAGGGAFPVTVTMNGCDYSIGFTRPGSTQMPETTGTMQASIICPAGQRIEIHVYENAFTHAENVSMCTYHINPQGPVPAGIYHNTAGMPADVDATISAQFTARRTVGPEMICGGNAFNQHLPITLTGNHTLRAFEDVAGGEGGPIGLHVF